MLLSYSTHTVGCLPNLVGGHDRPWAGCTWEQDQRSEDFHWHCVLGLAYTVWYLLAACTKEGKSGIKCWPGVSDL